jgi:lipopolysaccharide transport system ATP-binding protein
VSALIELKGVLKQYPKVHRRADRMRALMALLLGRSQPAAVDVLSDISFTVERGVSLGLIGENGAGKSTLLKIITGVLSPTKGSVRVDGRVGALLELGAGFHPDISGRENIKLAAALMGLSSREIAAKTPEIIEFADIGDYIDEPIKHYSSGMVVRLGFAVIAATKPDVLITDEVLAVGDETFQKKCVRWIEDYLAQGGTLLLVSHSMYHIQQLCKKACWIQRGRIQQMGDVYDVTQSYLAWHEQKSADLSAPKNLDPLGYEVVLFLINGETRENQVFARYPTLNLRVEIRAPDGRQPNVAFGVLRADGTAVYGITSEMESIAPQRLSEDRYAYELAFADMQLLPGTYHLRAHAMDPEGLRIFDTVSRSIVIRGKSREFGMVQLAHRWLDP